jgi:capsular polysaccharide export protein
MEKKERILLISLNGHQKKYFQELSRFLTGKYRVFHVHYAWANAASAFFPMPELPAELHVTAEELQQIIEFMQLKARYRHNTWIQRFFASEEVLLKQARSAIRFFFAYIKANDIDLICVWNGTLVPLAAAALTANKLNRKTLYFENGYLPDTTTVDPVGVNYRSSLVGKSMAFYESLAIEQDKLWEIYNCPPAVRALKRTWYQKLYKKNKFGEPEKVVLSKQFVLLPLQVHDDTQILLYSELKTMEQFLDFVIPAIEKYNEQKNTTIQVVVKEHPSDFGRIDYNGLKARYNRPYVLFLRFYPTPLLIEKAAGVITINSSVGIEALLKHKPVITLGRAFYNVSGLATYVQSPEDLEKELDAVVNQRVNHTLIDQFLYYLRYSYLVDGTWRHPGKEHFESVQRKIKHLFVGDRESIKR